MLSAFLKRLSNKGQQHKPARRASYRPAFIVLEERITPADQYWGGTGVGAGADWSVAANWKLDTGAAGAVPGPTDTAIFFGDGVVPGTQTVVARDTNSTMNLAANTALAGQRHIGKLDIRAGYTGTITFSSTLQVDVLVMSGGTRTVSGTVYTATLNLVGFQLFISQREVTAQGQQNTGASIFAGSTWTSGIISGTADPAIVVRGNAGRPATLTLAAGARPLELRANLQTDDTSSTLAWTAGSINVLAGRTVYFTGVFRANSAGGTMGCTGAGNTWRLHGNPNGDLREMNGRFLQVRKTGTADRMSRVDPQDGTAPAAFETVGEVIQDTAGSVTSVEWGTMLITGTFSQTVGDLAVKADTFLTVTADFTESADSNFNIELKTPQSGSGLVTVGGTVTLNGSTLSVTALAGFSGNQFTLISNTGGNSVVGTFAGLPEEATLTVGGRVFAITYLGGTGHDVVLHWVNQAPSGTSNMVSTAATTPYVFTAANFGFSDADGNAFLAVRISSLPTYGALTYNGFAVTVGQFIPVSDINAGKLVFDPTVVSPEFWAQLATSADSFSFQVQDNGGSDFGGVDLDPIAKLMSINVTL